MSFAANLRTDGELSDMTMISRRSLLATPALLTALGPSFAEAQAAQPLRIAMSIGDVPRLWGGPEAGFEGVLAKHPHHVHLLLPVLLNSTSYVFHVSSTSTLFFRYAKKSFRKPRMCA